MVELYQWLHSKHGRVNFISHFEGMVDKINEHDLQFKLP